MHAPCSMTALNTTLYTDQYYGVYTQTDICALEENRNRAAASERREEEEEGEGEGEGNAVTSL